MADLFSPGGDGRQVACLVDGSSYIFRAYHGVPHLSNSKGLTTNALFGYLNMLMSSLERFSTANFIVVLDAEGPGFRNRLYPDYKANRPPTPEDLKEQFPWVPRLTEALGVPMLKVPDVEADDVIATLARRFQALGWEVAVISGDKDLMQLVGPGVTMFDTMRERVWGPAQVLDKFGVEPSRVGDVLAIMGDSSDNIPGVKGIGPKGAAELVREFGSVEEIYASLDRIPKPRTRKLLEESRDLALLSRRLVELKTDVELEGVELLELRRRQPDPRIIRPLLEDLEFRTILTQLEQRFNLAAIPRESGPAEEELSLPRVEIVRTPEQLEALVLALEAEPCFALDTETTSTDPVAADLVGMSFAADHDRIWYLPLAHREEGQLSMDQVRAALHGVLSSPRPGKIGQNFKYDRIVLTRAGFEVRGLCFDTMIASHLLDGDRTSHSMDNLARDHLGWTTIKYKDVTTWDGREHGFDQVPIEKAAAYAGEDAWITWRLFRFLEARLEGKSFERLFREIEIPLSDLLGEMELRGVGLDTSVLQGLSREFQHDLEGLEQEILAVAGVEFNIKSPKQLAEILFTRLGLPPVKKTKTGNSTNSVVLEELRGQHPLPGLILDFRTLDKLKSTYVDTLPRLVNPRTGRLHTSFSQIIAATGRLSSSNPNLQNIPVRGKHGHRIRAAFLPTRGYLFLSADYSQIELRIMAHLSNDQYLIQAFRDGADIHNRTASELFLVAPDQVTGDMRAVAKTINFGVLYGMSAYRLAREYNLTRKTAQGFIDRYFQQFAGIKVFLEAQPALARESGYVETILGRRRSLPDINSSNRVARAHAERMAVNTPVQGSAADVVKLAMIRCRRALERTGLDAHLVLQVHDELIFEVRPDQLEQTARLVVENMEQAMTLRTPLIVDVGYGGNWAEVDRTRKQGKGLLV